MAQAWPQLTFTVAGATAEALEQCLFEAGAVSVTYQDERDQPILEPGPGEMVVWEHVKLVALFAQGQRRDDILTRCRQAAGGDKLPEWRYSELADTAWERAWMDDFEPMAFGENLWVCPTHCDPVDTDAINIKLDPGLAFGSGTHATTALCLRWLDQHDSTGASVLDYGCGSGILAIAAALTGAQSVIATDIDAQALQATQSNASLNGVASIIETRLVSASAAAVPNDGTDDDAAFSDIDILLANILCEPLCELAAYFSRLGKPGMHLVLSGLLVEQIDRVLLTYSPWFEFDKPEVQQDWAMLHGRRKASAENQNAT